MSVELKLLLTFISHFNYGFLFFFWITRKIREDNIYKSFQNFWVSIGESIVSSFWFGYRWSPPFHLNPKHSMCACTKHRVRHRDVRRGLQFVAIHFHICIVDVSLPALEFFPVLRERELFKRGCSVNENGKPLMVLLCMSPSVVSPREKSPTTRLSPGRSHTSALPSGHQTNTPRGTPKVSWKHTILNYDEMLFHDVRPIELATKIFKFLQKACKNMLIMIRPSGIGLSRPISITFYCSAMGDSCQSACYLIAYCVAIHLLM